MKADKWVRRWEIDGSKGDPYTVAIDVHGNWGCSCPKWRFRRQTCDHIKTIQARLIARGQKFPQAVPVPEIETNEPLPLVSLDGRR